MPRLRLTLTIALAAGSLLAVGAAPATAEFADADTATVHPGVQVITDGGQCTANFVFTDEVDTYLGMAAHCAGTGQATDTNGCDAGSLPLETDVTIVGSDGQEHDGTLAYSSWLAMQEAAEAPSANACAYNDFALVKIHEDDHDKVNPSIPVFGSPDGIDTDGAATGEQVYTYGNSSLRLGLTELSPHAGTSLGTTADGWTTGIYTVTPGLPGDSGSAVVDQDGQALGILVTLALAPYPASNGVTSLHKALDYARDEGGLGDDLQLVDGTEPFSGSPLSIVGGLLG